MTTTRTGSFVSNDAIDVGMVVSTNAEIISVRKTAKRVYYTTKSLQDGHTFDDYAALDGKMWIWD